MKKVLPLILLAAVVAVSGCTDTVATGEDLEQQTQDINQHTTEVAGQPDTVRKITLEEIDKDVSCLTYNEREELVDLGTGHLTLFERDSGVQTYDRGRVLLHNGIQDTFDADHACRENDTPGYFVEPDIRVDKVRYSTRIFQNGTVISNTTDTCDTYLRIEDDDFNAVEEAAEKIYSDCLDLRYRGEDR